MNKSLLRYELLFGVMLLVLTLTSCKNDPVNVVRDDVQITLLFNNMFSSFTPYSHSEMNMYSSEGISSKITIKAFVYDDDGRLVDQYTKKISNYNQSSISFSASVSGAAPLLVCFTYASWTNSAGVEYVAYEVTGEQMLSTLKIASLNASFLDNCIPWQVLGGALSQIDMFSQTIEVALTPLGGLAYLDWENIHSHNNNESVNSNPTRYVFMQKYNDIVTVKDGSFSYTSSLPSNYWFYSDIFPNQHPSYSALYVSRFMLPGPVRSYCYGSYSPSNQSTYNDEVQTGKSDTKTIDIEAGKQYLFVMDCNTYSQDVGEGILE